MSNRGRKVAFMADADQLVGQIESSDHFCGAGDERADSHLVYRLCRPQAGMQIFQARFAQTITDRIGLVKVLGGVRIGDRQDLHSC